MSSPSPSPSSSSSVWHSVLDADVSVDARLASPDNPLTQERAASKWAATHTTTRRATITPVNNTNQHNQQSTQPRRTRTQSTVVTGGATLVHRLAQRDAAPNKGYLGQFTRGDSSLSLHDSIPPSSSPAATATAAASSLPCSSLVHAGGIFPVRPSPVLIPACDVASNSYPTHNTTTTTTTTTSPSSSSSLDELATIRASIHQPSRTLSSYLFKQGRARKKWSRRYFTLLPNKFQLIYSHRKEESGGVQFDVLPELGGDDDESDTTVVTINLKRFRLIYEADTNHNNNNNNDDDKKDDHVDPLHFTIMIPATEDGTLEDGRGGVTGNGNTSSGSGGGGGGGSKERKIELKAESKVVYDEWINELKRLQLYSSYLSNYSTIVSRNKVFAMQGRYDLLIDPNPAGITLPSNLTHPFQTKKSSTGVSLLTSALTGDQRLACNKCGNHFGLLATSLECIDCHRLFCTRSTCVTARSYGEEGVDTFSVLTLGARNVPTPPIPPRLCLECERQRSNDAIYQKLLHGQLNLCIRIVEARDLMPANLIDKTSDPYVKFTINKQEYRTACIESTLNPVWERDAEFNIPWSEADMKDENVNGEQKYANGGAGSGGSGMGLPKVLCLEVWDRDRLSADEFLGCVYLNVVDLEKNVLYADKFPLRSRKEDAASSSDGPNGVNTNGTGVNGGGGGGGSSVTSTLLPSDLSLSSLIGKKRITGTLHLQVILTTASYTSELLRILPSLHELSNTTNRNNNNNNTSSNNNTPLVKTRTMTATTTTPTTPNLSQRSVSMPNGGVGGVSDVEVSTSPLETAIRSFLQDSHLHVLLLRSLTLILNLQLSWFYETYMSIMTYEQPFVTLISFFLYTLLIFVFPSEGIFLILPTFLLLQLLTNLLDKIIRSGEFELSQLQLQYEQQEAEEERLKRQHAKAIRKASSVGVQLKGQLKSLAGGLWKGFKYSTKTKEDTTPIMTAASPSPSPSPISSPRLLSSQSPAPSLLIPPSPSSTSSTNRPAGVELPPIAELTTLPPSSHATPIQTPSKRSVNDNDTNESTTMTPATTTGVETASSILPNSINSVILPNGSTSMTPDGKHSNQDGNSNVSDSLSSSPPSFVSPSSASSPDAPPPPPVFVSYDLDDDDRAVVGGVGSVGVGGSVAVGTGSVILRMRRLKRQVRDVQQWCDAVFDMIEQAIIIMTWKDVKKSQRLTRACIIAIIVTYSLSLRWLLFLFGVYKFSHHLLKVRHRIVTMRSHKTRQQQQQQQQQSHGETMMRRRASATSMATRRASNIATTKI